MHSLVYEVWKHREGSKMSIQLPCGMASPYLNLGWEEGIAHSPPLCFL